MIVSYGVFNSIYSYYLIWSLMKLEFIILVNWHYIKYVPNELYIFFYDICREYPLTKKIYYSFNWSYLYNSFNIYVLSIPPIKHTLLDKFNCKYIYYKTFFLFISLGTLFFYLLLILLILCFYYYISFRYRINYYLFNKEAYYDVFYEFVAAFAFVFLVFI